MVCLSLDPFDEAVSKQKSRRWLKFQWVHRHINLVTKESYHYIIVKVEVAIEQ